jgi:DNA (cytosine-5)-methyltransferase 1
VTGVDIEWQPNNPHVTIMADAMDYPLDGYDLIHASPPCLPFTKAAATRRGQGYEYPDLLTPMRARLREQGTPYIIENVEGAPMVVPITLCGTMFGLKLLRHRWFESNFWLTAPPHLPHTGSVGMRDYVTVAGHGGSRAARQEAMGIDWMADQELVDAVPPAYTEFLGRQAMDYIMRQRSLAPGGIVQEATTGTRSAGPKPG